MSIEEIITKSKNAVKKNGTFRNISSMDYETLKRALTELVNSVPSSSDINILFPEKINRIINNTLVIKPDLLEDYLNIYGTEQMMSFNPTMNHPQHVRATIEQILNSRSYVQATDYMPYQQRCDINQLASQYVEKVVTFITDLNTKLKLEDSSYDKAKYLVQKISEVQTMGYK